MKKIQFFEMSALNSLTKFFKRILSFTFFFLIFFVNSINSNLVYGQRINSGSDLRYSNLTFPIDNTYISKTYISVANSKSNGDNQFWGTTQNTLTGESQVTGETLNSINGYVINGLSSIFDYVGLSGPLVTGSTPGSFSVGLGQASYRVPLTTPPGTGGVQPELSLFYNNGGGNNYLGAGWSLDGLMVISRGGANKTNFTSIDGLDFDDNDKLYINGNLMVCIAGEYGKNLAEYRTENESMAKIVSYETAGNGPKYIKVWTKSGLIYEYGNTLDSRIEGSGRADVVFWAVNKVTDLNGNYITYSYTENNALGEFYISRIDYTGNVKANLSPYNSIVFTYENRPDQTVNYYSGCIRTISKRMSQIHVKYRENTVRIYNLNYQNTSNNISQLVAIRESGSDGSSFKPLSFKWQKPDFLYSAKMTGISAFGSASGWNDYQSPTTMADLNGDGLQDILGFGNAGVYVSLSQGEGTFSAATLKLAQFGKTQGWGATPRLLSDVNGDGLPDIVGFGDTGVRISLNTGNGNFSAPVNYHGFNVTPVPPTPVLPKYPTAPVAPGLPPTPPVPPVIPTLTPPAVPPDLNCPPTISAFATNTKNGNDLYHCYKNCGVLQYFNGRDYLEGPDAAAWYTDNANDWARRMESYSAAVSVYNEQVEYYQSLVNKYEAAATAYITLVTTYNNSVLDYNRKVSAYNTEVERLNGIYNASVGVYNAYFENLPKHPCQMADVNGDGRSDILYFSNDRVNVSLSTDTGFSSPQTAILNFGINNGFNSATTPVRMGDLNGDGMADLIGFGANGVFTSLSLGNGTFGSIQTGTSQYGSSNGWNQSNTPTYIADFNSDGLIDIIGFSTTGAYTSFSKGDGTFTEKQTATLEFCSNSGFNTDTTPTSLADVNGDGLTDIIGFGTQQVFTALSKGDGTFARSKSISSDFGSEDGWNTSNTPCMLADINGDGTSDIVGFGNNGVFLSLSDIGGYKIEKITDGFGKEIRVSYKSMTDKSIYTIGTDAVYPDIDLCYANYLVSSYQVSNGIGGFMETNYRYGGLTANLIGRGASLKWEEITDSRGWNTRTVYSQDYHYQGSVVSSQTSIDNVVVSKDFNSFDRVQSGTGLNEYWISYVKSSTNYKYNLDGTLAYSRTENTTPDNFGNVLTSVVSFSDGFTTELTNTYKNDFSRWIFGRLLSSTSINKAPGAPDITKKVLFEYDELTGLVTKKTTNPDFPLLKLVEVSERDVFGNIIKSSVTGHRGWDTEETRWASSEYDPTGRFVISSTNALGFSESSTYDPSTGNALSRTDVNGLTSTSTYDAFGRLVTETKPNGTSTTLIISKASGGNTPLNAVWKVRSEKSGKPETISYFDCLGRVIREESTGFNGTKVFADKSYDAQGLLASETLPYYSGQTPVWTNFVYDKAYRPVTISNNITGSTTTSYNGFTISKTNQLGQTRSTTANSRGELVSATDNLGNVTTYKHDAVGNQLSATNVDGGVVKMEYNISGKCTKLMDPDAGTLVTLYNAFGEVYSKTDNAGQVCTFRYDKLGRVTQQTEPGEVTTFFYDIGNKDKGQLTKFSSSKGYAEEYTNDNLGRRISTKVTIPNLGVYTTNYTYDSQGRTDKLIYPSGLTVENEYNSYNYLSKVKRSSDGYAYFTANSSNAMGQLKEYTFGNGIITKKDYDDLGRLTSINAKDGAVQNLMYSYNTMSNLTERKDLRRNLKEQFTYDRMNRLNNATVFTGTLQTNSLQMAYDEAGNITSKSDVGCYTYGQDIGIHAIKSLEKSSTNNVYKINSGNYVYDQNGNLTATPEYSVSYTSFNLPSQITRGNSTLKFDYAPGHDRYKEEIWNNGILTKTIYTIGGGFEIEKTAIGTAQKHYISANGNQFAVDIKGSSSSIPTEIVYLHHDHLGSIAELTKENGTIKESYSNDAWGRRRSASTWDSVEKLASIPFFRKSFTGHEQLDEVGLIHMNGRVYDPTIARFLSIDPNVQSPDNSQSYNRYSYVLNDPVNNIDPSGFSWLSQAFHAAAKAISRLVEGIKNVINSVINWVKTNLTAIVIMVVKYIVKVVLIIVISYVSLGTLAPVAPYLATFIVEGAAARLSGKSWTESIKAGVIAAVASYASDLLAGKVDTGAMGTPSFFKDISALSQSNLVFRTFANGVLQGTVSLANGGKFQTGFLDGVLASSLAVTNYYLGGDSNSYFGHGTGKFSGNFSELIADSVIHGAVAAAKGGKFGLGALAGAMASINKDVGTFGDKGPDVMDIGYAKLNAHQLPMSFEFPFMNGAFKVFGNWDTHGSFHIGIEVMGLNITYGENWIKPSKLYPSWNMWTKEVLVFGVRFASVKGNAWAAYGDNSSLFGAALGVVKFANWNNEDIKRTINQINDTRTLGKRLGEMINPRPAVVPYHHNNPEDLQISDIF